MRTNIKLRGQTEIVTDWYAAGYDRAGLPVLQPIKRLVDNRVLCPPTNFRKEAVLRVYERRVEVKWNGVQPSHLAAARRGRVSVDFSPKARKRMIAAMNQWRIPDNFRTYFITLTYPAEFSRDWQSWKYDLEKFRERLLRAFPDAQGFWRLELQRRGAPHYHIVLALPKGIVTTRKLIKLITEWWRVIAHKYDKHQGKAGTQVEPMWRTDAIFKYISKYVSKAGAMPVDHDGVILETMGRFWGRIGKPSTAAYAEFDWLPVSALSEVRRVLAAYLRSVGSSYAEWLDELGERQSFDCFGISGLAFLLVLDRLRAGQLLDGDERLAVLAGL